MYTISIIGCGWLGFPLAKFLTQRGYQIKGSTTQSEKLPKLSKSGIVPYIIDANPDIQEPSDFFSCEILIVNLPPRNKNTDDQYHEKQLQSIAALAQSQGISKIIFVSSTAVYPNLNRIVTEIDASEVMVSRGGVSLVKMENIFQQPWFQTTVLRFGGLYGPNRHPGKFLSGKKDLPGADNPVNMIHLEDCLQIIYRIVQKETWGETFNACSPNRYSRKKFYEKASIKMNLTAPTFNNLPAPFKEVSSEKLIQQLSYSFIH